MIRAVTGVVGILTALFPDRILDGFEAVALDGPGDRAIRPWVTPGIRAEGIAVAIVSLTGGRAYARLMDLTGLFGAVVVLFPQLYRRFALGFLYENPEQVEWNPRFTDGVRILGILYVLVAVRAFARRRAET